MQPQKKNDPQTAMSNVFYRQLNSGYPVAMRGEGCEIIDSSGKRYLDACGGAAVTCLEYDNRAAQKAMQAQMEAISFAHSAFFTTPAMEELAAWLVARAPQGIERVFFCGGGSEAVEAAVKLARQYWVECGKTSKRLIISRECSYHGNMLGTLSLSGHKGRRKIYEDMLLTNVHFVPPCYSYRHQQPGETLEAYGLRAANALEAKILELGAENVMAFIAEPVVGATLGATPPAPGYFKRIREICDQYDVLLILDEIMCGMGRTGTLFACEQEGIAPDIVTIAKALGSGFMPAAAMLASGRVIQALSQGSGALAHGHTYNGHAISCAVSLAVLKEIEGRDLLANVRLRGRQLMDSLNQAFGQHPHVGDIRGRGLFIALELVKDRATKEPFAAELKLAPKIKAAAMENGLLVYPASGTADGVRGEHILVAPPYVITEAHVEAITARLQKTLKAALPE